MERHQLQCGPHRNPSDDDHVTELQVLSDIDYFRKQLAQLPANLDRYSRTRRHVYLTLLEQRRKLLTATRAGRPLDWPEFPPAEH